MTVLLKYFWNPFIMKKLQESMDMLFNNCVQYMMKVGTKL